MNHLAVGLAVFNLVLTGFAVFAAWQAKRGVLRPGSPRATVLLVAAAGFAVWTLALLALLFLGRDASLTRGLLFLGRFGILAPLVVGGALRRRHGQQS
jgi:hypothetical protein